MDKIFFFLMMTSAMMLNSCGDQAGNAEVQPLSVDQLRAQAEDFFNKKEYNKAIDAYETLLARTESPSSRDYFTLGKSYYTMSLLKESDSIFSLLIKKQPQMSVGYLWRGRTRARIDSVSSEFLTKSDFEIIIELEASDPVKFKNSLSEAYAYLGYYYYTKSEFEKAEDCYNQIVKLNPNPVMTNTAREALKGIDKLKK
jgi:tetratricopeptide (TPR) repeat protein